MALALQGLGFCIYVMALVVVLEAAGVVPRKASAARGHGWRSDQPVGRVLREGAPLGGSPFALWRPGSGGVTASPASLDG